MSRGTRTNADGRRRPGGVDERAYAAAAAPTPTATAYRMPNDPTDPASRAQLSRRAFMTTGTLSALAAAVGHHGDGVEERAGHCHVRAV